MLCFWIFLPINEYRKRNQTIQQNWNNCMFINIFFCLLFCKLIKIFFLFLMGVRHQFCIWLFVVFFVCFLFVVLNWWIPSNIQQFFKFFFLTSCLCVVVNGTMRSSANLSSVRNEYVILISVYKLCKCRWHGSPPFGTFYKLVGRNCFYGSLVVKYLWHSVGWYIINVHVGPNILCCLRIEKKKHARNTQCCIFIQNTLLIICITFKVCKPLCSQQNDIPVEGN